MNIFRKLFGSEQVPARPSSKQIVYDYAQVRAQLNLPILDTILLPHPKDEIDLAFTIYTKQLEMLSAHSPSAREELEQLRPMHMMLSDFQDIDPEDRHLVSEINAGRRFAKFRTREGIASLANGFSSKQEEEDFTIFESMQNKYFLRSIEQDGRIR
jgi:hypothetical protein